MLGWPLWTEGYFVQAWEKLKKAKKKKIHQKNSGETRGEAQLVKCLFHKHEFLSLNPSSTKTNHQTQVVAMV
jgi:hypothetical protein